MYSTRSEIIASMTDQMLDRALANVRVLVLNPEVHKGAKRWQQQLRYEKRLRIEQRNNLNGHHGDHMPREEVKPLNRRDHK
jgi:hypothetical protein